MLTCQVSHRQMGRVVENGTMGKAPRLIRTSAHRSVNGVS